MSMNAKARSTPKDAGFLSRANEGELGFFSGDLPVDSAETGSPSSGKGLAAFCWPRGHQASHSIPRVADAPEVIGIDHQFYWLVPKIAAHLVSSRVLTAEETRSRPARSVDFADRTKVGEVSATKGPGSSSIRRANRSVTSAMADKRGRDRSLSAYAKLSGRNTPAAGRGLDHPRLNSRLLHQDSLLIPERPNGVASYLERLMSVVCHVAGLESCLMGKVPVTLRPLFEKFDRIRQRDYLPYQAFPLLQIYGTIKVRVHSYLTENVGDQQGWRRSTAPAANLFFRLFRFNTCRVNFFREARP